MLYSEHQVTFTVTNGVTLLAAAPALVAIAKRFRSQVTFINVSKSRQQVLTQSLSILSVAVQEGDCLQITARGIDAELTCFVLRNVLVSAMGEEVLFPTMKVARLKPSGSVGALYSAEGLGESCEHYLPPVLVDWSWHGDLSAHGHPNHSLPSVESLAAANKVTPLEASTVLRGFAEHICPANPQALYAAFWDREQVSSTYFTSGIALPHVMFAPMERMTIAVLCSPCGVTWHRDKAPVNLVLGLVIPNAHQPDIEDVKAVTCLTRNLLNPVYTQRLLTTKRWTDLQWLLTCGLRQLLPL